MYKCAHKFQFLKTRVYKEFNYIKKEKGKTNHLQENTSLTKFLFAIYNEKMALQIFLKNKIEVLYN